MAEPALNYAEIFEIEDAKKFASALNYRVSGLGWDADQEGGRALTHGERVISQVFWLDTEVCNGGFWQFYYNSSGDFAHMVVAALEELGARECAMVAERALAVFGVSDEFVPRDDRMYIADNSGLSRKEMYEQYDKHWYANHVCLPSLIKSYAHKHREEFRD